MNEIITVRLDELKLADNNVRLHPKRQIEEYRRSLRKFGQTKNAVIDEDNNVVIGNGLVIAAREEGLEEIYAIRRTDLTANDKLKIMVSDNKIFSLGVDNLDVIDEIFNKLVGDLDIPGYDEETLKSMVAEAEVITETISNYGKLDEDEITAMQSRPEPKAYAPEPGQTKGIDEAAHAAVHTEIQAHPTTNTDTVSIKCPDCGGELWLSKEQLHQLTL